MKLTKWILSFSALSLMSVGCSTTSTSTTATGEKRNVPLAKAVYSIPMNQVSTSLCPKSHKGSEFFAKKDFDELAGMANACAKLKRWSQVEVIGDVMAVRFADSPWGVYFLSLAAEGRDDLTRATWMVDLALKKADHIGILHYQKGRLLWASNDYKEAMDELLKAVQTDGSLVDAHVFLGQLYFRDQEFPKATQHFYTVLKARPEDPIALSGLAECRLQQGDSMGALDTLKRASRSYPEKIEFILREAYIYETLLNDKQNALLAYKNALQVSQTRKPKVAVSVNLEQKVRELEAALRPARVPAVANSAPKKPVEKQEVKR